MVYFTPEIQQFIKENTYIPDNIFTRTMYIPYDLGLQLKTYCENNGIKMNWFAAKSIQFCMSSSIIISCVTGSYISRIG